MKKMTMKAYGIGGLGVNGKTFSRQQYDFPFEMIDWLRPASDHEPIGDYARRMCDVIDTSKPFLLIGVSFGGMMSMEMAKYVKPAALIVISTSKSYRELPWPYRLRINRTLARLLPVKMAAPPMWLAHWLFSIKNEGDGQILKEVVTEADRFFVKWAVNQIVRWRNESVPDLTFHIHGDQDRLLYFPRNDQNVTKVKGGGHFIVADRAAEVSRWVNQTFMQVAGLGPMA